MKLFLSLAFALLVFPSFGQSIPVPGSGRAMRAAVPDPTSGQAPIWDGTQWVPGLVAGLLNPTITNLTTRGAATNNAAIENLVQTLALSGTNYTASWTNNPTRFRINLTADSGLVEANTTGTNRDMTIFVYGDNTHFLALPSTWVLRGGATNQPFPNGLTVFWVERVFGTNYLDTSIAAAGAADDTAFASSWNGVTGTAPSKNAVYDWAHLFDTDDDGKVNVLDLGAGIPKTDASGVLSLATPGTDYLAPTAEADVASAGTTDLGAQTTQNLRITGTTTITSFGTVASGIMRWGRFAGALTLTHNATSLILPGGANITTAAGDRFAAVSLGSGNWLVYFYQKADGTAIVGGGSGGNWTALGATNSNLTGNSFQNDAYSTNGFHSQGSGDGLVVMTNTSTGFTYTVQPHGTMSASVVKKGPSAAYSGLTKQANSSGTMTESQATAGTDYYAPGSTDVAIADGGTGQSTANAGLDALQQGAGETTVASATTTDLGAVTSQKVSITGTTTITGFGTVATGTVRKGRFTGALTLTHNATSLILPGGRNITTAAGDAFEAVSLGSGNWSVYCYQRANGYSPSVITSSQTYDPANLTTGSSEIQTWTVAGVTAGDTVIVSHTQIVSAPTTSAHWTWWAVATATDTVVTKLQKKTGGTVNLASGNIKIVVFK